MPEGADYADEFSGGWDGTRFPPPFVRGTRAQALADAQAAAVELDFGGKRVVVLLNDSGGEIKAGGLSTAKRFAAGLPE